MSSPYISVVISTYTHERLSLLEDCLNGLENQSMNDFEVVVVSEDSDVTEEIQSRDITYDIVVLEPEKEMSLSEARNFGAHQANGEIIAFIDDDAVPTEDWIQNLAELFTEYDFIAGGGPALPDWRNVSQEPAVPAEFYWLLGASHSIPEEVTTTQNTFGTNIAFRKEVFRELGGFNTSLGKRKNIPLQGEETDLAIRLIKQYEVEGIGFHPEAAVEHKVFPEQVQTLHMLKRAFWQGYSKAIINKKEETLEKETDFLKNDLPSALAHQVKSKRSLYGVILVLSLTAAVGAGFLYGTIRESL